jgi:hypothetical protein
LEKKSPRLAAAAAAAAAFKVKALKADNFRNMEIFQGRCG